jgi:hypothetical protein
MMRSVPLRRTGDSVTRGSTLQRNLPQDELDSTRPVKKVVSSRIAAK